MATYFIKIKGKAGYIKHESEMASTMYSEMKSVGHEVVEAFVFHGSNSNLSKVSPKTSSSNAASGTFSGSLKLLNKEDIKINYERLAKSIVDEMRYYRSEPIVIDISKHLIRYSCEVK